MGLWLPPVLPLLGYGFAHWDRALMAWRPWTLLPLLAAWACLQAGTLWLNAARDRDEGEVLLGVSVPVPDGTATLGLLGLLLAVALAALADPLAGACALGCAVLSVLYSHPRTAWKGHPVLGPAVNALGYGVLSPLAGYAVVGTRPTWRAAAVLLLIVLAVIGWTFISQAFQGDEDRARGDRTLAATHGTLACLRVGRLCLGAASVGLVVLVVAGWLPGPVLVGLVGAWWTDRALAAAGAFRERLARRALWRGVATLGLVLAGATGSYVADALGDGPVAGLATRAGHPDDRLPRPPHEQNLRDAMHRVRAQQPYRPDRVPEH